MFPLCTAVHDRSGRQATALGGRWRRRRRLRRARWRRGRRNCLLSSRRGARGSNGAQVHGCDATVRRRWRFEQVLAGPLGAAQAHGRVVRRVDPGSLVGLGAVDTTRRKRPGREVDGIGRGPDRATGLEAGLPLDVPVGHAGLAPEPSSRQRRLRRGCRIGPRVEGVRGDLDGADRWPRLERRRRGCVVVGDASGTATSMGVARATTMVAVGRQALPVRERPRSRAARASRVRDRTM